MGTVHVWLLVLGVVMVSGAAQGSLTCNSLWAANSCPVWYHYKKLFVDSVEKGTQLLRCINDQTDETCAEQQLTVKGVFRNFYRGSCEGEDCMCDQRRKMVRDLMANWESNGLTTSDTMRDNFVTTDYESITAADG